MAAEGETRKFLNKMGPNVGDRIFGLVDMVASLSPTQDIPDLKKGAGELMDGINKSDVSKVTAGATALAGAIMSLGIPGSYAQYRARGRRRSSGQPGRRRINPPLYQIIF
ncbi:MAG: hypothetical protein VCE74_08595 [Alphaproteobacteria bacterium]|jgi:hypothetical protein